MVTRYIEYINSFKMYVMHISNNHIIEILNIFEVPLYNNSSPGFDFYSEHVAQLMRIITGAK